MGDAIMRFLKGLSKMTSNIIPLVLLCLFYYLTRSIIVAIFLTVVVSVILDIVISFLEIYVGTTLSIISQKKEEKQEKKKEKQALQYEKEKRVQEKIAKLFYEPGVSYDEIAKTKTKNVVLKEFVIGNKEIFDNKAVISGIVRVCDKMNDFISVHNENVDYYVNRNLFNVYYPLFENMVYEYFIICKLDKLGEKDERLMTILITSMDQLLNSLDSKGFINNENSFNYIGMFFAKTLKYQLDKESESNSKDEEEKA